MISVISKTIMVLKHSRSTFIAILIAFGFSSGMSAQAAPIAQSSVESQQIFLPLIQMPSLSGRIAFLSSEEPGQSLRVFDAKTNTLSPAIRNDCITNPENPVWSPDGTHLIIANRVGTGDRSLCRMSADGTDTVHLTGSGIDPVWSPDGTHIAFTGRGIDLFDPLRSDIFVVSADGTQHRPLTEDPASDSDPVWSPDSTQIAFSTDREGPSRIYLMAADGTGQTRLTATEGQHLWPRWSPDSQLIAFVSRAGGDTLYTVKPDGSELTQLTSKASISELRWSPDGQHLAFVGEGQLWLIGRDGTGLRSVTPIASRGGSQNSSYAWSPDGHAFVFEAESETIGPMAIIRTDGTRLRFITTGRFDMDPAWTSGSR
ncbi:MAG: LpqB family beta-propeller domain-containing protein [Chloroflexota bacterium]